MSEYFLRIGAMKSTYEIASAFSSYDYKVNLFRFYGLYYCLIGNTNTDKNLHLSLVLEEMFLNHLLNLLMALSFHSLDVAFDINLFRKVRANTLHSINIFVVDDIKEQNLCF